MKKYPRKLLSIAVASAAAMSSLAYAQEQVIEEVITIGTRTDGRTATQSVAPIDVISSEDLMSRSDGDMANILRQAIPSYNVNDQPISDAATIVRPANLRGLAPDQTLVMINGKRRHRAAVIAFLGGGLSDGAQGADLSVIPAIALKRVEVLRDGAAAQYGSDAIAGVLNFVLKDDTDGGSVEAKVGSTFEGDGDFYTLAGNYGFGIGDGGFGNVSVEYGEKDPTSRSSVRDDAASLRGRGLDVRKPAQIWGQPEVRDDIKLWGNFGFDVGSSSQVYLFGNYASKTVEGGFFFRNPENRSGVYGSPDSPLIADLTPNMSGNCSGISHDDAIASADCYSFREMFPNGFTPQFGGDVVDYSGVIGFRGETGGGIVYDISYGGGYNEAAYFMSNTINPSLGPDTPTSFEPGTYVQTENNFNVDLSKAIGQFNIAGGFEWREETFEAQKGDTASYVSGPLTSQGFGVGSNGFQGFGPQVAGEWSRENYAVYGDVEWMPTDALLLGAAVRWEDYDTFGSTTNWKLSARYDITDRFAVRMTASTGFRAPTPGQANVVNTTTAANAAGDLIDQGTVAATTAALINPAAKELQPEDSENISIGVVWSAGNLDVTVDAYRIEVSDRIALTGNFDVTDENRQVLIGAGVPGAEGLAAYRFFANDFDTKTEGVDIVATWAMFDGNGLLGAAYNYNTTDVVGGALLDATRIRQLEENLPKSRANFSYTHNFGPLYVLGRANYYSSVWEAHLDSPDLPISVGSEVTFDAEVGLALNNGLSLIGGVSNLFDDAPSNPHSGVAGSTYAVTSPYGFQGGTYYLRANYAF